MNQIEAEAPEASEDAATRGEAFRHALAKTIPQRATPSQTAHSLMTPDGLAATPILVSWTIRGEKYEISKVRWGQTVSKEEAGNG